MDYKMLYRILGTILSYYQTNKDVLTENQIKDLAEQSDAICDEMKRHKLECFYNDNGYCGTCAECYISKCPVAVELMNEDDKKFYCVQEIK